MPHSFSLDDVYIGPPCPYNCHRRGVCKTGQCYCDETGAGNFSHGKETFRMVRDLLASVSKGCGFESQPSTSVSSPCLCDLLMLCKWQFFIESLYGKQCVFFYSAGRAQPTLVDWPSVWTTHGPWLTACMKHSPVQPQPWSLTDCMNHSLVQPHPWSLTDYLYEPFTCPTPPLVLDTICMIHSPVQPQTRSKPLSN